MDFKRSIVILLLAAFACRQQDTFVTATYSPFPISDSVRNALADVWQATPRPGVDSIPLNEGPWLYLLGNGETLDRFNFPDWRTAQQVILPHRINLPDSPMWYLWLADTLIASSVLMLDADDGAQVFVNGSRLTRIIDDRFELDLEPGDSLVVRVLNNAMAGGLRRAAVASHQNYEKFSRELSFYHRTGQLVEQTARLHQLPIGLSAKVMEALDGRTDQAYNEAAMILNEYPMLSQPVVLPKAQSFVVRWPSSTPGDATVWWGTSESELTNEILVSSETTIFELPLKDMDSAFYYQISQKKTSSDVYHLSVPKPVAKADDFSFTLWADSQGGWKTFSRLMYQTNEYNDRFSVGAGDLVANGSDSLQWKSLLTSLGQTNGRFPFYLVPGNHDYDGYYDYLNPQNFNRFVTTPSGKNYFSWQYANCAFIAIDPNEAFPIGFESSAQKEWFLSELQSPEWKAATWRFVVLHQPPFSQGWPGYHGDEVVRQLLDSLYEPARIDFVVAGHTHDYERLTQTFGTRKVHFLVVGGGGGGLEPDGEMSDFPVMDTVVREHHLARMFVHADSIHLEVRGLNENIIDQSDFIKQ